MAARRRRKRHDDHGEHVDERWLLTYSDLITLLMALFMVLFSISSVNTSKFQSLQRALQDAFSGRILPGGQSIKQAGGTANVVDPSSSPPESSLQPYVGGRPKEQSTTSGQTKEQQDFQKLKRQIDAVVAEKGLTGKVQTHITADGLSIRLLTDNLLFDSGSATPRPGSLDLLGKVARILGTQPDHQLLVEGHTDSVPIRSAQFVDNWALSGGRAQSIVRTFAHDGISPRRMTAAGRGQYKPAAPNDSAAGRTINRRVEILVPRAAAAAQRASIAPQVPSIAPDLTPQKP